MAITNFIPTIWSENLSRSLDKQYIAVSNCNRDYEGDIKNMGDTVKICGVGSIDVNDYTKNSDMSNPQTLSDTVKTLTIDKAKYFNFQIDDIDRAQSTPKLMDAAMSVAANALANEADKHIYSLYSYATYNMYVTEPTAEDIVDKIIKARELLYTHDIYDTSDIVVEVSPTVAALILKAKVDMATDNDAALENGYLGSICGCKIYVSNNIVKDEDDSGEYDNTLFHRCFIRSKRAIAFAEQLSEIEAYRPEKRFADAVKGLHLYGAKVMNPNELIVLSVGYSTI